MKTSRMKSKMLIPCLNASTQIRMEHIKNCILQPFYNQRQKHTFLIQNKKKVNTMFMFISVLRGYFKIYLLSQCGRNKWLTKCFWPITIYVASSQWGKKISNCLFMLSCVCFIMHIRYVNYEFVYVPQLYINMMPNV